MWSGHYVEWSLMWSGHYVEWSLCGVAFSPYKLVINGSLNLAAFCLVGVCQLSVHVRRQFSF